MNWSDSGLVIGVRPHGESAAILELMTREHGRHLGLVHGGRSSRQRGVLQPGNEVEATWRARLDEQLGTYAVEGGTLRAGRLLGVPMALYGLSTLAAHLRLLPERDPHPALFAAACGLATLLDDPACAPAALARFEVLLLAELGFGLDLSRCAASGRTEDLVYVSPKSGRAVSREAGAPYRTRLLPLPMLLRGDAAEPDPASLAAAFRLTGHFLDLHLWAPRARPAPDERARFVQLATQGGRAGSAMVGSARQD